jgi:hypothetical protein
MRSVIDKRMSELSRDNAGENTAPEIASAVEETNGNRRYLVVIYQILVGETEWRNLR